VRWPPGARAGDGAGVCAGEGCRSTDVAPGPPLEAGSTLAVAGAVPCARRSEGAAGCAGGGRPRVSWRQRVAWAAVAVVLPVRALAGGALPAAGQLVHDPTAYVQHVRAVRAALVAEEQRSLLLLAQARQHALRLREHEASLRQLAGARAETLAPARAAVRERVEEVARYLGALERLGGSLERLQGEAWRIQQAHAVSGLTWREYALREQRFAQARARDQQDAFAEALSAMRRAAEDHRAVQALQARAGETAGAHESLQLLNQQMAMLVAQSAVAQAVLASAQARERHAQALVDTLAAPEREARERAREAAAERAAQASAEGARTRARAAAAIEARRLR